MTTMTYNTRTLAACAKRLRYLTDKSKAAGTKAPRWTVVWRYREGFRLQVLGEDHEPGGWETHSNITSIHGLREIERDLKLNRADEIAGDSILETLRQQPADIDNESLRFLATLEEEIDIARAAQDVLHHRNLAKFLKTA